MLLSSCSAVGSIPAPASSFGGHMKKVVFLIISIFVCTSFSFAADLESESFDVYSLDPLTNSALDYAIMPLADASWSTTDSSYLKDIRDAFYLNKSAVDGSVISSLRDVAYLKTIFIGGSGTFNSPMNGSALYYLQYLPNLVSLQTMEYNIDYIEESLTDLSDFMNQRFGGTSKVYPVYDGPNLLRYITFSSVLEAVYANLNLDGLTPNSTSRYTLYHYIRNLSETLASEDDKLLAESQKSNREEIENSFLTGSSGSTSLGASDFGDLSDVGGTVKDSISLNGQASVSSFTSGLAGADESGQGWFSAATRDSLDSVTGSISTFSLDDPYNMSGWQDRYAWLEGD